MSYMDEKLKGLRADDIARAVQAASAGWPGVWAVKLREGEDAANNQQHARLVREEDGATLWLSLNTYPRLRLSVSGEYPPQHTRREGESGRATFDPAREPAVLAREIARRVLPVYLPAYAKAREEMDTRTRVADEQRALAADIAAALHAPVPVEREWRRDETLYIEPRVGREGLSVRAEVRLTYRSVKFEVEDRCPEGARQVAAALSAVLGLGQVVADDEAVNE